MRFATVVLIIFAVGFGAQAESLGPFGVATVLAPENIYAAHWRKLQDDWAVELKTIDQCRVERERCHSRAALQFMAVTDEAKKQIGRAQLGYVNRAINLAIRPMNDLANYGIREIWAPPLATLERGAGDCTDFAIAKYYALGEIGVALKDRRLLVVRVKQSGQEHTVLAVREDQHWLILDNRSMTIVDAADLNEYVPLLEFDHRGVWRFLESHLAYEGKVTRPDAIGRAISSQHSHRRAPCRLFSERRGWP
ncbi:MAG TPA: transglutaminase-like cysteine peptidase [Pseudolabrys sp.]